MAETNFTIGQAVDAYEKGDMFKAQLLLLANIAQSLQDLVAQGATP